MSDHGQVCDGVEGEEMTLVYIPFLPQFEDVMLSGKKRMTSRTKRYGQVADVFDAFGATFLILAVEKMELGSVAVYHFKDEGFNCMSDFVNCWHYIHPRKGFDGDKKVWTHRFRKLNLEEVAEK